MEIGLQAYNLAELAQDKFLNFQDSNIHVWVEQGSIKYRYKICASFVVFFNVISEMDGFVGGLEKIVDYSNKAMTYLTQESIDFLNKEKPRVISHKRSAGFPGKLKSIMFEVRTGNLNPDEATQKVLKLLEKEDEDKILQEKFLNSFYTSSVQIYKKPIKQLELYPFHDFE